MVKVTNAVPVPPAERTTGEATLQVTPAGAAVLAAHPRATEPLKLLAEARLSETVPLPPAAIVRDAAVLAERAKSGVVPVPVKLTAEMPVALLVHDPVTRMILNTNIYLKVPVSSYDGRRVIILEEPMLAPNAPNGRIYSSDYVLVTSPNAAGAIKMQEIRHLYLQYEVEPLVYARAQSMERLTPLLKPVADAPLEYTYKTEIVPLVTECLIKAIEARTMDVGMTPPTKPTGTRARLDLYQPDKDH